MSKFGFDSEDKIDLPIPTKRKPKADTSKIKEAAKAGESLGFISREAPINSPKRRRRRRTEPQSQILISGPKRIIDAFQDYCDAEECSSYWSGLEKLMKNK